MTTHGNLLREVENLARSAAEPKGLMQRISDHIHAAMSRYNSISFRLVDEAEPGMLILGPYTGSFNPLERISFGQGLCGAAASEERTIVVDDVTKDGRYLTASSIVKSEIVVPLFVGGKLFGEMDIQSYFVNTFKAPEDRQFIESCAGIVAKYVEAHRKKS